MPPSEAPDADAFKSAMRHWVSGVTVVTCSDGDSRHGMTVSAFTSVSADPPRILVCTGVSTFISELIERAGVFAVHVLSAGQEELSRRFAGQTPHGDRFADLQLGDGLGGCPILPGALVVLECSLHAAQVVGDHVIQVGEVERCTAQDASPLIYFGGGYRRLAGRDEPSAD